MFKSILIKESINKYSQMILTFILFLLMPYLHRIILSYDLKSVKIENEDTIEERNTSAFAQLLGEFRVGISDILFLKTERYLHLGVVYAPHKDINPIIIKKGGTYNQINHIENKHNNLKYKISDHEHQGHSHTEYKEDFQLIIDEQQKNLKTYDHEDHNNENVNTLIRTPETDWRGFIGKIEREIKPWRDPKLPHLLSPGIELLPWYRLITISNPHNIRGYVIGTYWLLTENNNKQREQALEFINEGIKQNSESFQLYLMKGRVYLKMGDKKRAIDNFLKSRELGLKKRQKDILNNKWTSDNEEDLLFAIRYEAILYRDNNNFDKARNIIKIGLNISPEDKSLILLNNELSDK